MNLEERWEQYLSTLTPEQMKRLHIIRERAGAAATKVRELYKAWEQELQKSEPLTDAERDYQDMRRFQKLFIEADQQLRYAKILLSCAADALEKRSGKEPKTGDLVAELRQAAK